MARGLDGVVLERILEFDEAHGSRWEEELGF